MDKKKILIFIDWFYPGFRGGGPLVSCLNLIREINYDYEIFIFTRANDYTVNENYKDLELNKWIDFQAIANIYYCESSKLGFLKINQIINQVNPHIIYLNSMFSYYFTILPIIQNHFFLKNTNRKVILVPRGMLMDGKLQFNKIRKIVFLKTFRTLGLQKKLTLQVTSLEEKNASINRLAIRDNQVHLIPNIPSTYLLSDYQVIQKKSKQLKIYFSSRIAREKNILFALEVVSQLEFSVQFDIFGTIDHDAYWELCLAKIVKLPPNITVNYKGAYQANTIQEIFKPYHIFLFPTFGENYGHVIIEALALGKPVIITQNTPWIDLEEKKAGWIIDLENEKRYQEVLKSLFEMTQSEYDLYSQAAYQYAFENTNEIDYIAAYRTLFQN